MVRAEYTFNIIWKKQQQAVLINCNYSWNIIVLYNTLSFMLRLHLPRASYDLFVYNFPCGFQASSAWLQATTYVFTLIRPSCDFFDGFLQRTGAKSQTERCGDRREIVRSSCYLPSGTKKSHGCRTTPLRLSYAGSAEIVRWLCDPRELLKFRISNVYN